MSRQAGGRFCWCDRTLRITRRSWCCAFAWRCCDARLAGRGCRGPTGSRDDRSISEWARALREQPVQHRQDQEGGGHPRRRDGVQRFCGVVARKDDAGDRPVRISRRRAWCCGQGRSVRARAVLRRRRGRRGVGGLVRRAAAPWWRRRASAWRRRAAGRSGAREVKHRVEDLLRVAPGAGHRGPRSACRKQPDVDPVVGHAGGRPPAVVYGVRHSGRPLGRRGPR
jgi:hypothetical protein